MIVTVILYLVLPGVVLSQDILEIVEENCKVCCSIDVQVQDYCICSNMIQGYNLHCTADSSCRELCLNYTMDYDGLKCIAMVYASSSSSIIEGIHTITAMTHVQCSTEESSTPSSMTIAKATSNPLTTLLATSSILTSEPVTVSEPLIITLSITIPVIVITTVLSIILITYLITSKRRGLNHDTAATTSNITELSEHSNYNQVQPDPGAALDHVYNVLDPVYNTLDPIHEDTQPNPPPIAAETEDKH